MNGIGSNSVGKPTLAVVTFILLTLLPVTCLAELALSLSPASPRDRDTVYLRFPSSFELAHYDLSPRTTMDATKIIVWFYESGSDFNEVPPAPAFAVPIGQFPEGTYQVEARGAADGRLFGSARFDVKARTGWTTPKTNYTDMWWNPAESGWGVSIHQHSTDVIFAVWFVYGSDGNPLWYVMPTGTWLSPVSFRGPIYRTNGPSLRDRFDPARVGVTQVGTGTFIFGNVAGGLALFEYAIDGAPIVSKSLQRQPF
jgi:hypothetical protein